MCLTLVLQMVALLAMEPLKGGALREEVCYWGQAWGLRVGPTSFLSVSPPPLPGQTHMPSIPQWTVSFWNFKPKQMLYPQTCFLSWCLLTTREKKWIQTHTHTHIYHYIHIHIYIYVHIHTYSINTILVNLQWHFFVEHFKNYFSSNGRKIDASSLAVVSEPS